MYDALRSYLTSVHSLGLQTETVIKFSVQEDGKKEFYVIDPFSVRNICMNCSLSREELPQALKASGMAGKIIEIEARAFESNTEYSMKYSTYTDGTFLGAIEDLTSSQFTSDPSPTGIMNLLTHLISARNVERNGKPATAEEAIFEIKNEVGIPDDFMPEHLMSLVESKGKPDFGKISREIQFKPPYRNLYLLGAETSGGIEFIQYLVPARGFDFGDIPGIQAMKDALRKSYSNLEKEPCYSSLVRSRTLKTVLFTLEKRNTRKLPPQLRNPEALELLSGMGIIDLTGGSPSIKESITPEQILEFRRNSEDEVRRCALKWLSSPLTFTDH